MFIRTSPDQIEKIFHLIEEGNLTELKRIVEIIPEQQFVKLTNKTGHFNPLIYAIDKEKRDIVLWLI